MSVLHFTRLCLVVANVKTLPIIDMWKASNN